MCACVFLLEDKFLFCVKLCVPVLHYGIFFSLLLYCNNTWSLLLAQCCGKGSIDVAVFNAIGHIWKF